MPRPRKYETDAEKQAAYRQRIKADWVEVDRASYERLMSRLDALQAAVSDAVKQGNELAIEVRTASVDTLLDNLTEAFKTKDRCIKGECIKGEERPQR